MNFKWWYDMERIFFINNISFSMHYNFFDTQHWRNIKTSNRHVMLTIVSRWFSWKQFNERITSVYSVNTCFIIMIGLVEFVYTFFHTAYGSIFSLLHQNIWHLLSFHLRSMTFVKTALFPWLQWYNVKAGQRFPSPEICVSMTRVPHQTLNDIAKKTVFE